MEKGKICKIRDVYRAIALLEQSFQQQFGVNINEAMMLCTLNENRNVTAGALADQLALSHSNTSKVICAVEKKGFISRSFDKNDKRLVRFNITKAGREHIESIIAGEIYIPEILNSIVE